MNPPRHYLGVSYARAASTVGASLPHIDFGPLYEISESVIGLYFIGSFVLAGHKAVDGVSGVRMEVYTGTHPHPDSTDARRPL